MTGSLVPSSLYSCLCSSRDTAPPFWEALWGVFACWGGGRGAGQTGTRVGGPRRGKDSSKARLGSGLCSASSLGVPSEGKLENFRLRRVVSASTLSLGVRGGPRSQLSETNPQQASPQTETQGRGERREGEGQAPWSLLLEWKLEFPMTRLLSACI